MTEELPGAAAGEAAKPAQVHSDQSLILRIQTDYQKYEQELEAAELRDRQQEERLRRTSMRLRLGLLVLMGLLVLIAGAFVALLVRDAVIADGVVVEPFHAPPDLAAHGVDGAVIARGLLDECIRLRLATHALAASHGITTPWDRGSKLELPSSGLSIEELARMLRARFGHELHVTGELVEAADDGALALTVRADGLPAHTLNGPAGSLAAVLRSAAEYVYGRTAPGLWALHLSSDGRYAETMEFTQALTAESDKADKPYLLMASGLATEPMGGSPQEARALYRAALKAKPDYWEAWINVQNTSINLGDEEGAWSAGEAMRQVAGGRPGRAPQGAFLAWDLLSWNLPALLADLAGEVVAGSAAATALGSLGVTVADVQARLHDLAAAEQALPAGSAGAAGAGNLGSGTAGSDALLRARLAVEAGDLVRAATLVRAFDAASGTAGATADTGSLNCWIALAEEAAGHPDRADALLLSSGTFVDCYRFRADILDGRGDWPAARKAYGAAVALARDLPAAYYSWGLALARHGDFAAAEEKLTSANQRGPHWADPLKAWGDLLARQGKAKEALAKYDEALKYAPRWTALAEARAQAQTAH
jgi:tetratricopeptide (TPR) repeat protein